MKTLKLDHDLAVLVQQGKKTSTWRMFDDKDISVNDDIQLIDKVNLEDPNTWRCIGIAHVKMVIQKRLGDVDAEDFETHERFSSNEEMLKTYRDYYGPQVSMDTPIKIVRFILTPKGDEAQNDVHNATDLKEVKLYTDGGSRGNPGPSASGFAIWDMDNRLVVEKGIYLGITTNNQAEYQSLKFGLEEAQKMGIREVHVYMDSLLVVNQMLGIFKVKNRDLWPIHSTIADLVKTFKHVSFVHVPRALNKVADAAVNEALDAAASTQ